MCDFRLPAHENDFKQYEQLKGFSPECTAVWRASWAELEYDNVQSSHLYTFFFVDFSSILKYGTNNKQLLHYDVYLLKRIFPFKYDRQFSYIFLQDQNFFSERHINSKRNIQGYIEINRDYLF